MEGIMRKLFFVVIICVLFSASMAEAATLSAIRGRVREYLHETDEVNSIYTNTMLNEAITQGQFFVLDALPVSANYNMLISSPISLSNGVAEYSLPVDFRRVVAFQVNGKQATLLRPEEYFNKSTLVTTKDSAYCIIGSKLVISPTPTATGTSNLLYMKQPGILTTDASVLTTLPEFDTLVMLSAVQYVLFTDNQTARAGSITNEIVKEIKAIAQRVENTTVLETKSNTQAVSAGETK